MGDQKKLAEAKSQKSQVPKSTDENLGLGTLGTSTNDLSFDEADAEAF